MFRWLKNRPTSLSKRQRVQCRTTLERLEARECLSTAVSLVGNSLNIVGDAAANNVAVVLRDGVNDISVTADNVNRHFSSLQVQNMNVDLKGGDDKLFMQLGNDNDPSAFMFDPKNIVVNLGDGADSAQFWFGGLGLPNRVISTNVNITVNAGAGNDELIANFGEMQHGTLNLTALMGTGDDNAFAGVWGNIDTGATVKLNLQGQDGNDTLNTWETYNGGYDNVNIAPGALFDINVNGGAGNDQLNMTYGGNVRGNLQIRQDGGIGNDSIKGDLHLQWPSTGAVDAVFSGGDGRDGLEMDLYGSASVLRALIDGGAGFDRATSVGNVQIINANELIWPIGTTTGTIATFALR
jgi:hypothetical protein